MEDAPIPRTWREQFERVERWLERIDVDQPDQREDYEDFLWSFFQNAWHVVDWIRNDEALSSTVRDSIYATALAYDSLRICNALANRTKHLRLTRLPHRPDADFGAAKLTVRIVDRLRSGSSDSTQERDWAIEFPDGRAEWARAVARQAVADWAEVITKLGLPAR